MTPSDRVQLGKTDVYVSPLGLGAWQWGDRMFWQYGGDYSEADIEALFKVSLEAGINFIDSAEIYGMGRSEKLLGRLRRETDESLVIATKYFPYPWRFTPRAMRRAIRGSLKRLDMAPVDIYYAHWPSPAVAVEVVAGWLADVVDAGHARAVGVSNYNADQTRRAHAVLAERGIPLACNQIPYSLLDRKAEDSGTIEACQELDVTVVAYSPIAQGLLTGKYTPENKPPGLRGRTTSAERLQALQELLGLMREVGNDHGGKSASQVALNWCIAKNTVPIPGAKNVRQAVENGGALGWLLSADEVQALDQASSALL